MADYRGYVTAAGQQFEALAKQMNYPVKIGFIEIGDGILPDSESPISRTSLVHKIKQFPATVEQDPSRPGEWVAKCYIPADDSLNGQGYFIREMSCKLVDQGAGILYSYRRVSNDWKPVITEGEAKSFIYILRFIPTHGEIIAPTINPSVVLVNREDFNNEMKKHKESRDHPEGTKQDKGMLRLATENEALLGLLDSVAVAPKEMKAAMEALLDIVCPIGLVLPWVGETPPNDRFVIVKQQVFDPVALPKLAKIFPAGRIPFDPRGLALRWWDAGRGRDVGRVLMSEQGDAIRPITGSVANVLTADPNVMAGALSYNGAGYTSLTAGNTPVQFRNLSLDVSRVVTVASENRMANSALTPIMRVK
ncbi:MAG: phage tail protein [Plesiomonas sp.]